MPLPRDVQIVIPYHNGAKWIERLLETIPAAMDVLIVDDHSPEALPAAVREKYRVVRPPKRGYWAGACNFGAKVCPGRDLLFLNQDIHFRGNGALVRLEEMRGRNFALTGNWVRGNPRWPKGYADGVFMYVRRDAWDQIGGMDARRYPMWGSSCLLQAQIARAGFRVGPMMGKKQLDRVMVHHRQGNMGESFRQLLAQEVGHTRSDGNIYKRVPPYVNVIITAHGDYEKYLPEAMEGIMNQTRQDFKVMISLDGTASPALREMAADYADDFKGIEYHQLPGGRHGPPAVRNFGIRAANPKYYVLMNDGDDVAEPEAIELMVEAAERNPGRFIYCDLRWIGDRGGVRRFPEYNYEKLLQKNFIPSFILFPIQAWRDADGYPGFMKPGWDDYGFAIALGRAGWCGVRLPEVLFNYRRHGHSRNHDSQKRRPQLRALLREHFPNMFNRRFHMVPGCCGGAGGGNPGTARSRPRPQRINLPPGIGEQGMVGVRYIGLLGGTFPLVGGVTGKRYLVKKGWSGWMDVRDAKIIVRQGGEYEYTGEVSPLVSDADRRAVQPKPKRKKMTGRPRPKPESTALADWQLAVARNASVEEQQAPEPEPEPAPAPAEVPADVPLEQRREEPVPGGLQCPFCDHPPYKTPRGLDTHVHTKHENEYWAWKRGQKS